MKLLTPSPASAEVLAITQLPLPGRGAAVPLSCSWDAFLTGYWGEREPEGLPQGF